MSRTLQVYRAFIASAGDVSAERDIAEECVQRLNRAIRDTTGIYLDVRRWEHRPPVAPNPDEDLQVELDRDADQAHFFILILGRRYGTVAAGKSVSNTEGELYAVLRARERNTKIKILVYQTSLADSVDPGPQEEAARNFRKRLEALNLPSRVYQSTQEFKEHLTHDLYETVLRIRLSPFKQESLRTFWRLGDDGGEPRLAILYPPVDRGDLKAGRRRGFWLNRLLTQLALEDYKSIQTLVNGLRLMGFTGYDVYPYSEAPHDMHQLNRAWLCLPRNKAGLAQLRRYSNLRFAYPRLRRGEARAVEWNCADGERTRITSPMGRYMQLQRSRMDISGEWNRQLSQLVAKDFAVLCRLREPSSGDDETRYDYVFAGLRGLGTWGATWFLDQKHVHFRRLDPAENVEMLLEVTFVQNRITDVVDVSNEPPAYFERENSDKRIKQVIKDYTS
jgi:hypothetical protein